jgi:hypothetical protein
VPWEVFGSGVEEAAKLPSSLTSVVSGPAPYGRYTRADADDDDPLPNEHNICSSAEPEPVPTRNPLRQSPIDFALSVSILPSLSRFSQHGLDLKTIVQSTIVQFLLVSNNVNMMVSGRAC